MATPILIFFALAPMLGFTFFVLSKSYNARVAYIMHSWLPVGMFSLGYSFASFSGRLEEVLGMFWMGACTSFWLVLGGIVLVLHAFNNDKPCFTLVISTCLAATPFFHFAIQIIKLLCSMLQV